MKIMKKTMLTTWIAIQIILFSTLCNAQSWEQMGSDINGQAIDYLGFSISLSKDAQTLAVGVPLHTKITNGSFEYEKGKVEVYRWSNSKEDWIPKGEIIYGNNDFDHLGSAVSLSSDGNVLAVSMPTNDDAGTDVGQVRVYSLTGNTWIQKGQDLNGTVIGEEFGTKVDLSGDGNILAVGTPKNNANGANTGQVTIFEWSGNQWKQRGANLKGSISGDLFGAAIEINENGKVIAIGAPYNVANSSSTEAGYAKIFVWDGLDWAQKGSTLIGENKGDFFGQSISLSANGETVAVGAPWNSGQAGWKSGHVRVFEWANSDWAQLGSDIDGEEYEDLAGQAVSISANGRTVAIGAPWNGIGGHARVFTWDNNAWLLKGSDIDGENFSDDFGRVLSLSGDGSILAIAAPDHAVNGTGSGQVQVYDGSSFPVGVNQPYFSFAKAYPNPIMENGKFYVILDKAYKTVHFKIFNINGLLEDTYEYHLEKKIVLNLEDLPRGFYFINVETNEGGEAIFKIIKN